MGSANRLIDVFDRAKSCDTAAERDRFVAEACGDDAELREQVLSLLQVHDRAANFLQPTPVLSSAVLNTEKPGDRIGRYKLLEKIGEGGCGKVFMAEQERPVRRRVALKIIKLGMDTHSVIARFEAERQALALMDHPNIAKVFDGGTTQTGRPYFVMELVRGIKITEYCDRNNLSTDQRLKLFTQVCHAIQHAHQKGIIHRDIKPSNILVTVNEPSSPGCPKVIDFGIAKATTEQRLTDKTVFTAFEQFIGTPAYMSPEQAMMTSLDIDTRTDIYALGVLLYELLTGQTPFDANELMAVGLDAMRRTICEQEPAKPSTRLSQEFVAADVRRFKLSSTNLPATEEEIRDSSRRLLRLKELIPLLRGDLDWIVMKALEKDRARRYETANGLAMDIQRHLSNEPVIARPPSTGYRLQKLIRRNKVAFIASSVIFLVLLGGIAASTWQAIRATRAEREQSRLREQAESARNNERRERASAEANRKKAEAEAVKSRQVARFMQDMLKGVGPSAAVGRDTTMLREILEQTVRRFAELKGQPAVEADLRTTLGNVYLDLGEYTNAAAMVREALELRKNLRGAEHPEVATTLDHMAAVLSRQGRRAEAETTYRESLAMKRKLLGNEHTAVADSLDAVARVVEAQGNLAEAESIWREALALRRKLLGSESISVAYLLHPLAWTLNGLGKRVEAEAFSREELAIWRKSFGNDHPNVSWALADLTVFLREQGKMAEAEVTIREALAIARKQTALNPGAPIDALRQLAWVLYHQSKPAEAEAVSREVLAMCRRLFGNEHPEVAAALEVLATTLEAQAKSSETETALRECLTIREYKLPDTWLTFHTRSLLGGSLLKQKKYAEAGHWLLSGYEGMKQRKDKISGGDRYLRDVFQRLVQLHRATGQVEKTAALWREEVALRRQLHGSDSPETASSLQQLALFLRGQGKLTEAETTMRESLAIRRKLFDNEHIDVARTLNLLTYILRDEAKLTEAEAATRESLAIHKKLYGSAHPETADALKTLAQVLGQQGNFVGAKSHFLEAAEHANAHTLNEIAWALATDVSSQLRDGPVALRLAQKAVAGTNRKDALILDTLAAAHAEAGQFLQAARVQQEAIALLDDTKQKDDLTSRLKLYESNLAYRDHGKLALMTRSLLDEMKPADAEPVARECLALRERLIPGDWRTFNTRSMLGGSLLGQKKYSAAEALLLSGYEGMQQREAEIPPMGKARLKETLQRLVQLYEATGPPEKAADWNRKLMEFDRTEAARKTGPIKP